MEFENIVKTLGTGERGYCRVWIQKALLILDKTLPHLEIEVREVEIEPTVFHSFLRLSPNQDSVYLADGTGCGKHKPYFGLEAEAPPHLQKGKRDMINSYR